MIHLILTCSNYNRNEFVNFEKMEFSLCVHIAIYRYGRYISLSKFAFLVLQTSCFKKTWLKILLFLGISLYFTINYFLSKTNEFSKIALFHLQIKISHNNFKNFTKTLSNLDPWGLKLSFDTKFVNMWIVACATS